MLQAVLSVFAALTFSFGLYAQTQLSRPRQIKLSTDSRPALTNQLDGNLILNEVIPPKEIIDVLKSGRIPLTLAEELRIVDPESSPAIDFEKEILRIIKSLHPEHDFESEPIQVLLTDDDRPNAFRVMYFPQTTVGISRGLIERAESLPQIEAVIEHELEHSRIARREGEGRNSVGEEILADLNPLPIILDAGHGPREVLRLHKNILQLQAPSLIDYIDVHPSDGPRYRYLKNALFLLKRERGKISGEAPPFPIRLKMLQRADVSYL